MKLCEVLDFEQDEGTFELLNIRDIVDEDVLKSILQDGKLQLVFNGLTLEDKLDNLITPHYKLVAAYITGEVQKNLDPGSKGQAWYEDFDHLVEAVYDSNTMCIYTSEHHGIKFQNGGSLIGDVIVYLRIEYMSEFKKTRIFLMNQKEFNDIIDDPDVLDLKKVVDL